MFKRMRDMIDEQDLMTTRIDDDVTMSLENMENAKASLGSYLDRISSNRALILKVFAIIIGFIIWIQRWISPSMQEETN